jgi:hypothetical protein
VKVPPESTPTRHAMPATFQLRPAGL